MRIRSSSREILTQWFLRITKYADELLNDLTKLEGWPEKVRTMQRNWIGRSEGTFVDFMVANVRGSGANGQKVTVFTTRVDTIFRGDQSVQLAPEHRGGDCVRSGATERTRGWQIDELLKHAAEGGARGPMNLGAIEKHGVTTGRFAENPFNGERVPIWIANYILADYGTGAIMSVPAHDERDFEFATKYGLAMTRSRCSRIVDDGPGRV